MGLRGFQVTVPSRVLVGCRSKTAGRREFGPAGSIPAGFGNTNVGQGTGAMPVEMNCWKASLRPAAWPSKHKT